VLEEFDRHEEWRRWREVPEGPGWLVTAATLLFLPALYVAWFRIHPSAAMNHRRQIRRKESMAPLPGPVVVHGASAPILEPTHG
jgi:hypothetical protein